MEEVYDYKVVKTYEDACEILGKKPIDEPMFKQAGIEPHFIALMKLEIISMALWGPDFEPKYRTKVEYWCSWWRYYTPREMEYFTSTDLPTRPKVLFRGSSMDGSSIGFGCRVDSQPSLTSAGFGFRLCQETEEKALYFATQFADLWVEGLPYDFYVTERLI